MAENLVEQARKVIGFTLSIKNACKKKGIDAPTDDKIAEYIEQGYGMTITDFMADYEQHEGIFRDPIHEFAKKVNEYAWVEGRKPTMEEMVAWTEKNGYDVNNFLRQRTIASYEPLERVTLLKTLTLDDDKLVALWNQFIEESAKYGEDSYIYNLKTQEDNELLRDFMEPEDYCEVLKVAKEEETNYIQWFSSNNGEIVAKKDIKGIIVAYWSEIFERVMAFPDLYGKEYVGFGYFYDFFFVALIEFNGYHWDAKENSLIHTKK